MEGEQEGGLRLSKRFNDKNSNGEVDYKTKAGTAWSHSYLNQKPWHPLSYPNQRRKWIAEQTHANHERRSDEVRREYEQEQEFFRQTSLISKKEKEKIETMQAVSFMYIRPPGYNPESAKAAEIADQEKNTSDDPIATSSVPAEDPSINDNKKKPRPKDAFGRSLPTEQEFEVLNNAPRLDTGAPARAKPFGIEVRNVKCLRCGKYGHQSGDRECPLKDAVMPNEESRLKRDDPLTAIIAQTDPTESLKWELKQKPGMSPPRGGFNPDDPNQQIVAEDIFDEYGGFLAGGGIPELLTNFSPSKPRKKLKKSKCRREASPGREVRVPKSDGVSSSSDSGDIMLKKEKEEKKRKRRIHSREDTNQNRQHRSRKGSEKHGYSFEDSDSERHRRSKDRRRRQSNSYEDSEPQRNRRSNDRRKRHSNSSDDSDSERNQRSKDMRKRHSSSSEDSDYERHQRSKDRRKRHSNSAEEMDSDRQHRNKCSRKKHSHLSEDSERHLRSRERRRRHSYSSEESDSDELHRSKDKRKKHSHSSDRYSKRPHRSEKRKQKHSDPGSSHDSDEHHR